MWELRGLPLEMIGVGQLVRACSKCSVANMGVVFWSSYWKVVSMEEHLTFFDYNTGYLHLWRFSDHQEHLISLSSICVDNPPSLWRGRGQMLTPSSSSSQSNANTSIHGGGGLQFWHFKCHSGANFESLSLVMICTARGGMCVALLYHWSASCHGHRSNEICLKLWRREGHCWGTSPSDRHVPCVSEDGLEFESDFEFLPFCHANRLLCSKCPCFEIQELVVAKIGGESGA